MEQGGHAVPHERILARYPRTRDNPATAVTLADLCLLFDTSARSGQDIMAPRLVARLRLGVVTFEAPALPRWARSVLGR